MASRRAWGDTVRAVAQSVAELLRAEMAELNADLRRSGKTVGRLLALVVATLFLVFWLLAVLIYAAIVVAHLWLPMWGAALAVAGALLLAIAILGGLAWSTLNRLESPARTVRRRVEDHFGWWTQTLSPDVASRSVETPGEAAEWIEGREDPS